MALRLGASQKWNGDSANILTFCSAADPNTRIPETKAFMVNVKKCIREVI